jgi:cellulose synthase/poly-beta-1,6-N-acetylglucosamine synthase-like glycosyltransferase
MPHLSKYSQGAPLQNVPLVSIIIPARNESRRISKCIETLKSQTYSKLEIIIVDDSTDNTVEVIKNVVGNDKRFKIIKQDPLLAGWIGKPFALQQGSKIAQGKWLLFIDADTYYDPILIERSMEFAVQNKLDMLSLAPHHICKSFWEKVVQPIPLCAIIGVSPLAKVNDPGSRVSLASGPFIMIKHSIFNNVGGYQRIKGHIADDIELAQLIKTSGFTLRMVNAQSLMSLRMYERLKDIWDGWSKNSFLGFIQKREIKSTFLQILFFIVVQFLIFIFLIFPFLSMISSLVVFLILRSLPWMYFLLYACVTWVVSIVVLMSVQRVYHIDKARYAPLTLVLGGFIAMGIFANSALKTLFRTGVTWKGRIYPIEK